MCSLVPGDSTANSEWVNVHGLIALRSSLPRSPCPTHVAMCDMCPQSTSSSGTPDVRCALLPEISDGSQRAVTARGRLILEGSSAHPDRALQVQAACSVAAADSHGPDAPQGHGTEGECNELLPHTPHTHVNSEPQPINLKPQASTTRDLAGAADPGRVVPLPESPPPCELLRVTKG
jgi:hypothetical protein